MSALEQAVKACRDLVSALPHHHQVEIVIRSDRVLCRITRYERGNEYACASSDQGDVWDDAPEEVLAAICRTLAKHGECGRRT